MSTMLLLTDAWQPAVLQIVPFSNNNARANDKHMTIKGASDSRSFPVLAVTRQQKSAASSRSGGRSYSSFRSDLRSESDTYSVISSNTSGLTNGHDRWGENDSIVSKQKRYKMYPQKSTPEMHSEVKEAIRFSVQDINDQVSSSSSLASTEKGDDNDKHDRVDNTRTRLPKPSLSNSPDAQPFYSPVNGIRRSVPLTPGELELQRIRESYYVDQQQRRKKYKLNVNQLPRSTTPINDHDPDKLNMKQVIAFLQTKTVKENTKDVLNERKGSDNGAKTVQYSRIHGQQYGLTNNTPMTRFAKNTVQSLSRSNSETKPWADNINKPGKHENTRQVPGCVSVMSVKSSPNFPCNRQSQTKSSKTPSIKSSRSFKDNKSDKQKAAKEFKLYRFLAIAPGGENQGCGSTVSNSVPTIEKSFVTEELKQSELPRKQFAHRSTDRETGTTRVLHRHAINRAVVNTPPRNDITSGEGNVKPIRLPVMVDPRGETPDCDLESVCTTPIPILKTKRPLQNTNQDRESPTKQSPVPRLEVTQFTNADDIEDSPHGNRPVMTDFMELTPLSNVRAYKTPGFPKVNITAPKQIKVNVPDQSKKIYSQEIVRLTLRQEKNATRVTSYMSDIECASARQLEENSAEQESSATTPRSNDNADGQTISPLSNASLNRCMV